MRHCRHADVGERLTGRGNGGGLTHEGQIEAALLSEQLASEPITAVYCSPRQRTRETAAAIADRHGLRAQVSEALDEIDFGDWTGKTFAELDGKAEWDRWNSERANSRPPGGESMAEAVGRAARFIDEVGDADTAVFVTHCDIIRGLLCRQQGRSFDALFEYDVEPGSVWAYAAPVLEAAA